jgi:hypothetical protein
MATPLLIPSDSAKIITDLIFHPQNQKNTQHLLCRRDRMESYAKKKLHGQEDFREFLISYLTSSSAYFANTNINQYFQLQPEKIDVFLAKTIVVELLKLKALAVEIEKKVAPYRIPLSLVSKDTKPCNITANIYMYCIKEGAVLVLAMKMFGDIIPRHNNEYHLNFYFSPITFLDFVDESREIPKIISETGVLNFFNMCIAKLFTIFMNKASMAIEQTEWSVADQEALDSLTPKEKELLDLYLPIFNRYGDIDVKIDALIEEIEGLWNKGTSSQNRWVVFSPSYCLPTWFENFYNSLMDHDKEYLRNIDPNNITEQDKAGLLVLLVEYKNLLIKGLQ